MLRLRVVYAEEMVALFRLFFLTEERNLEDDDYFIENGYLFITSDISEELNNILNRFQTESIWAPLWVEGVARGLFSKDVKKAVELMNLGEIPEIPWTKSYGPIIFINRNYYLEATKIINNKVYNWIYAGDVDIKRLITGKIIKYNEYSDSSYYEIPKGIMDLLGEDTIRIIDVYLQGWNFLVLPTKISEEKIIQNFRNTYSSRVPGKRKIKQFADIGYAISFDSLDELISLLNNRKADYTQKLCFPRNLELKDLDAYIWIYPVKVGNEDLQLQLSYYRETNNMDSEYYEYRLNKILNLDEANKYLFLAKHSIKI